MKNGLEIDSSGDKVWYLNDQYHREDGPAIERIRGTKMWYINGERHNENGPAVVLGAIFKVKQWWLQGELVYSCNVNHLGDYDTLTESFKQSIIKYELSK
jgi:hypothetical protein